MMPKEEIKMEIKPKVKKKFYKRWWFWVLIIAVVGGVLGLWDDDEEVVAEQNQGPKIEAVQKEKTSEEKEEENTQEKEEKERLEQEQVIKDKEDYIAVAKTYEYKDLERDPDKYKGEIAVFEGEVIQVSESIFDNVIYRVKVNGADIVYVTYKRSEGEPRVLEGDIIRLYGELDGITTYTSVLAGKISVPAIKAKYIDIK